MLNLNMLRKKNIFQQSPMTTSSQPDDEEPDQSDDEETDDSEPDDDSDDDSTDEEEVPQNPITAAQHPGGQSRFQQLFGQAVNQPQGPLSQKLTSFLSTPSPAPEDYQPGKVNRLAAILGGASEGYQRGAGAGIKTANQILDRPYQQAMNKYALEGKRLNEGANLESKNLGRAASLARTAMTGEHNERTDETNKIKALAQDRHWQAQDAKAAAAGATKGWTHYTNPDGHLIFVRPTADGETETLDGGKAGESIPEKTRRVLNEAAAKEGIRVKGQKEIQDNAAVNTQMENNRKAGQELIKEQEKAKLKPVKQDETTVTELKDDEGKVKSTRTTTKTKTGASVKMKDKNGKEWMVKPENVEAFKKANGLK